MRVDYYHTGNATEERFSLDRLKDLSYLEIQDRFRSFRELSKFDDEATAVG